MAMTLGGRSREIGKSVSHKGVADRESTSVDKGKGERSKKSF